MKLWTGTSGWHYKHWLGNFYPSRLPASKMLAHYVEQFDTVELNNSFYKLPDRASLARWRDVTPDNFVFAVKASRFLTHMKKLKDAEQGLERFLGAVEVLEPKLGPILFQLPPHWAIDVGRLASFLEILPGYHKYAFEFRNPTWNTPEVLSLLRKGNHAYCIFHLAGYASPDELTAEFTYIRLHGPGGKYQGTYSDAVLKEWVSKLRSWQGQLSAAHVYFDNDQAGYAPVDAMRLKELASEST